MNLLSDFEYECCKNCEYSAWENLNVFCARHAPTGTNEGGVFVARWPQVRADCYCGDWRLMPLGLSDILKTPTDELTISVRTINKLRAAGVKTVRDLVLMGEKGLRKLPEIGTKSMKEIEISLTEFDVHVPLGISEEEIERFLAMEERGRAKDVTREIKISLPPACDPQKIIDGLAKVMADAVRAR